MHLRNHFWLQDEQRARTRPKLVAA